MIKKVDFQLFTFCNRRCPWCPPFTDFRPTKCNYMTDDILYKTIDMMHSNKEYFVDNLDICLSRYCEPFYDPDMLFKYSKILKKEFPKSDLSVHTNGDLLEPHHKYSLNNFDVVYINRYDDDQYTSFLYIIDFFEEEILKGALKTTDIKLNDDMKRFEVIFEGVTYRIYFDRKNTLFIKTRGSSNKNMNVPKRIVDCGMIGSAFMIESNGDVLPCCDTIGFIEDHNKLMNCGNVLVDDFKTIYNNILDINIDKKSCCDFCHAKAERIFNGCDPIDYGKTYEDNNC